MDNAKTTLKRSLKTRDLIIYGLVFMIPVGPIAVYNTLVTPSSGKVSLCYFIGMMAMLFTGLSYRKMAAKYPYAGSAYAYIQKGANAFLGFMGGWAILLDYFLLPATVLIIGSSFAGYLLPTVPKYGWVLFFILFSTVTNVIGVNVMAKLNWVLFALQIAVLILFVTFAARLILSGAIQWRLSAFYDPQKVHWAGIFQATGIVVLSYLGFDAIGTLAEEAVDPKRTIGKAMVISIFIIGFIFIVTTFFAGLVYPNYHQLSTDGGFLKIIQFVGGNQLVTLTVITVVLSFAVATCQASQAAVARILYAMGRDGVLPKKLAYLHPRFKTPIVSLILVGIVVTPIAMISSLNYISLMVSFGALVSFLLLNGTVIWRLFIKEKHFRTMNDIIQHLLFPLIGIFINAWILINLQVTAHIVGIGWLILGVMYVSVLTKGFRKPIPQFELG